MSETVTETSTTTEINPEDCFQILLATDIHLGYLEENEIRGEERNFNKFGDLICVCVCVFVFGYA